jgi:hypothetical protein
MIPHRLESQGRIGVAGRRELEAWVSGVGAEWSDYLSRSSLRHRTFESKKVSDIIGKLLSKRICHAESLVEPSTGEEDQ